MYGYDLPVTIEIGGNDYAITDRGHYKMVLDCFSLLNDENIPKIYRFNDCLKIFYEDINSDEDIVMVFGKSKDEALAKAFSFFNCDQPDTPQKNNRQQLNLVDWARDSQLICAAILEVAGVDIRSLPFLHWHTFLGYYMSIRPESVYGTVLHIRGKIVRGKKLEKYETEFLNNNPQYFKSMKEIEEEDKFEKWLQSQESGG